MVGKNSLGLWRVVLAFSRQEGAWDFPPDGKTNRPQRNNNPCDLRAPVGPNGLPIEHYWEGQTGVDAGGFAQFVNFTRGLRAALVNFQTHFALHPYQTLAEYVAEFAPASDGNDPARYATAVAAELGSAVDLNTRLGDLT